MSNRAAGLIVVSAFLSMGTDAGAGAESPTAATPIRGILVASKRAVPSLLTSWKAKGANAVLVPLDETTGRDAWAELAARAKDAGLALYPWVEIARSPALADAHPEWMASPGGHHDDWRTRFPDAPPARKGEVIKMWPWVPIGYAPAFEAHRARLKTLLDDLPGPWAGVFLNDLQAGPSSCGCGNDQCRWALDYGSTPTAPKTPGDDPAARLVAEVKARHPGKSVVPVWVTECEMIDLPKVEGGTGLCGGVPCARNTCWPAYARAWNPLLGATEGPVAVALWPGPFRRPSNWVAGALALFFNPPRGGNALAPGRAVAVLQGWDRPERDQADWIAAVEAAGTGWVVALDKVEQSWTPRVVKAP